MGQMGHDLLSRKPRQKGQFDAPMGQMGQWVMTFFLAPAFAGAPSGHSCYRFTYKTKSFFG
jgi:hypothetical protein